MNQKLINERFKIVYDYNEKTNNWSNLSKEGLSASIVIEQLLKDNWRELFNIPESFKGN